MEKYLVIQFNQYNIEFIMDLGSLLGINGPKINFQRTYFTEIDLTHKY